MTLLVGAGTGSDRPLTANGIARATLVIIVILTIAVAGVATYLAFSEGSKKAQFSPPPLIVRNPYDIFGNFSKLSFSVSFQEPFLNTTFSENANFSGSVVRSTLTPDGERVVVANISQWSYSSSLSESNYSSALVYVAQNGTVLTATIDGVNTTSSEARGVMLIFESFFNASSTEVTATLLNSTVLSSLAYEGSSIHTSGNLKLQVLTYSGSNVTLDGQLLRDLTIAAGSLPSSNLSVASYFSSQFAVNGTLDF